MKTTIKSLLFFLLLAGSFSCDRDSKNEISPSEKAASYSDISKLSKENKDVIKYLQDNGFVLQDPAESKSNRRKIASMEEAKKMVSEIKNFEKNISKSQSDLTSSKSGRVASSWNNDCSGPGTYYINGAWGIYIAAINIVFVRDEGGRIVSVGSSTGGLVLAWSWEQTGVNYSSNNAFCIDGYFNYGMDFQGFSMGYKAQAYIKVNLTGCSGNTIVGYGHC